MYDTHGTQAEVGMRDCKPDYEKLAADLKKRTEFYKNFRESLIKFIGVIGRHSLKREPSSLPELLGQVELDIVEQGNQFDELMSKIETDEK